MKTASPPVIALLFFAVAILLNLAFVYLLELGENSSMGITVALIIIVSLVLNHFYKEYKKRKTAESAEEETDDFISQKENFHEFSFKSEFARLREKYSYELETNDSTHFGEDFEKLLSRVEKDMLSLARNPKNIQGVFDYHTVVTDQIILALLDKVAVGNYIRKGVPDFDTQFFVTICRKILADELKDGNISEEKHDRALNMLEREIQNGRVTVNN